MYKSLEVIVILRVCGRYISLKSTLIEEVYGGVFSVTVYLQMPKYENTHAHTHTNTHARTHTHIHTNTHVRTYARKYECHSDG